YPVASPLPGCRLDCKSPGSRSMSQWCCGWPIRTSSTPGGLRSAHSGSQKKGRGSIVSTVQMTADTNPLLQPGVLPRFDLIRPEHVVPAMQQLLPELEAALQRLEAQAQPTWEGLVEPLERLTDRLSVTWGIVG